MVRTQTLRRCCFQRHSSMTLDPDARVTNCSHSLTDTQPHITETPLKASPRLSLNLFPENWRLIYCRMYNNLLQQNNNSYLCYFSKTLDKCCNSCTFIIVLILLIMKNVETKQKVSCVLSFTPFVFQIRFARSVFRPLAEHLCLLAEKQDSCAFYQYHHSYFSIIEIMIGWIFLVYNNLYHMSR